MQRSEGLSRRRFLYGAALAAGSVGLSACTSSSTTAGSTGSGGSGGNLKGSATKPLGVPTKFSQAPTVKGLPPVTQRLPKNPYVVPHRWVGRGKYGGNLNMVVFSTTGAESATSNHEFFYGYSPLRWLNDGLDVGPGTVDKWSSNADASEWTLHFREGLRWSDGQPFSVDDVLFWWEDMVLPGHDAQTPPSECLSSAGHVCTMKKIDQWTLKISYDSPQPGLPYYLASWAKGAIGKTGAAWMFPKHYLKQFHPKYNPKVPKNWDTSGGLWELKADWMANPDCPTLAGYKCKSFDNNTGVVLERNPYYYAVTKDGDQLPYIDTIAINVVQNPQVIKLQVQQGKVDYCHGPFNQIDLSDVATLSRSKQKGDYEILLWESGSGTGSMFFLNYDYTAKDPKYGKLFRDKRFRQAISYAWDRVTAQKALYFGTGELTTGTLGPKAPEYHTKPSGPSLYDQWRDSYKTRDVKKAKALLAEMGLKDTNNDGYVEFPDGSKLTVQIPYSADISTTDGAKDDQLVANAKDIGLHMVRNPISPVTFGDQWAAGQFMSHTNWEVSNGSLLVAAVWLLPLEPARWAPLEGAMYAQTGTSKEKAELNLPPLKRNPPRMAPDKGGPIQQMWDLYNQAKREPDYLKRTQLFWNIIKIHISDGPFFMGTVANFLQPVIVKNGLRNVPSRENLAQGGLTNDWELPCPAVYDPEAYYWDDPSQHTT